MTFIELLLSTKVNTQCSDNNYKDQILRYFHELKWQSPKYKLISCENKIFNVSLLDNSGNEFTFGTGKTKKEAEQEASKNALNYFNVLNH